MFGNIVRASSILILSAGSAQAQESWPPCCETGDCPTFVLKYAGKLSMRLASLAIVDAASSSLSASASSFAQLDKDPSCCFIDCNRTDGSDDSDSFGWNYPPDSGGSVWAASEAGPGEVESPHTWADTYARSQTPIQGTWVDIMELKGTFSAIGPTRCDCHVFWNARSRGIATGTYDLWLDPTSSGITIYRIKQQTSPDWTSMMFTSVYRLHAFMSFNAGIGRAAEFYTSAVLSSRGGIDVHGLTLDPGTGDYISEVEVEKGDLQVEIVGGETIFNDEMMDANGDGRFNDLDAQAVRDHITSTDAFWLRFDVNANGTIDEFDADYMDVLISDGVDSGFLGDVDHDGVADCGTDLSMLYPFPTATFGDSSYDIRLDANVDGLLDSTDLVVIQRVVFRADFDHSGFVDTDDFDAFTVAFTAGDESADVNMSGFVDTDDFDAFNVAFQNGC